MNIFIDSLSARFGGGATYLRNILPQLACRNDHKFFILLSSGYQQEFIDAVPANIEVVAVNLAASPLTKRWSLLQLMLPKLLHTCSADVFLALAENVYLTVPVPMVMLARNLNIYSSQSLGHRSALTSSIIQTIRLMGVQHTMQKAARVVFVSDSCRGEVLAKVDLEKSKTRVVYHGLSDAYFVGHQPKVQVPGEDYFLAVGTVYPHKNYSTLVEAYAAMEPNSPNLLIAGRPSNPTTYAELQNLVLEYKLQNRVRFLGEVPPDELPELYTGALAFVFPSCLESFGHPLVEAMASGTPVIASDLSICKEICQDAATYFSPLDSCELTRLMSKVSQDYSLRLALSNNGRIRAAQFSWKKCAADLLDVLEETVD